MKKLFSFLFIFVFASFSYAAFLEDVVSEEEEKVETKTEAVQTNAVQSVKTNVSEKLDINTLKFKKEIGGFAYKSTKATVPAVKNNIKRVMKAILPLIKKIPDNYKIQVIGYADASGPEYPEGNKPGNIAISKKRAESVVDYIVKNYNINRDRFEIIGRGSKDLKDSNNPKSAKNRRVVIKFEP